MGNFENCFRADHIQGDILKRELLFLEEAPLKQKNDITYD